MIGIFDSGIGGRTVYTEIRKLASDADIVYFADSANAPYGNKSQDEVRALTRNAIAVLLENGATEIVSACNSASVSMDTTFRNEIGLAQDALIEMVGPTVADFIEKEVTGKIVLTATQVTVDSGIYTNAFAEIGIEIEQVAIPELAGAIEGQQGPEDIEQIIRDGLQSVNFGAGDILILGCTHFPYAIEIFKKVVGNEVEIYNPAIVVAKEVCKKFNTNGTGEIHYIFS